MKVKSLSRVWLLVTPSRQAYCFLIVQRVYSAFFVPTPVESLKEESENHLSKENTFYPQAGGEIDIILKHSVVMKE